MLYNKKQKAMYNSGSRFAAVVITAVMLIASVHLVLASDDTILSQTINAGTLDVVIVDANGDSVASPGVTFEPVTFNFDYQTSTGTLGTATEMVRVSNPTTTDTWSLAIAATNGASATWSDGGTGAFDFNDTTANAADGADADSVGGQLTFDPSVGTLAAIAPYADTNVTKGSSAAFAEGTDDSITLLSGAAGSDAPGRWDFTNIGLSQDIPAAQSEGVYTLDMTLTAS
jgi:hypothetical protein